MLFGPFVVFLHAKIVIYSFGALFSSLGKNTIFSVLVPQCPNKVSRIHSGERRPREYTYIVEKKTKLFENKFPHTNTDACVQHKSVACFVHFSVAMIRNRSSSLRLDPFLVFLYFWSFGYFCEMWHSLSVITFSRIRLLLLSSMLSFACDFIEYHAMRPIETRNYGFLCLFGRITFGRYFLIGHCIYCMYVRSPTTHQKKPKHVNWINNCIDAFNFFFFQINGNFSEM